MIEVDLPPPTSLLPYRKVRIRQGMVQEIIQELTSGDSLLDQGIDDQIRPYIASARITVEGDRDHTALTYGDVLYSELNWVR